MEKHRGGETERRRNIEVEKLRGGQTERWRDREVEKQRWIGKE